MTPVMAKATEARDANQAEVLDSFRAVREDLSRMTKAFSILEVADRVSYLRPADQRRGWYVDRIIKAVEG